MENATRKANSGRGSEREDGEELGDDEGSNCLEARRVGARKLRMRDHVMHQCSPFLSVPRQPRAPCHCSVCSSSIVSSACLPRFLLPSILPSSISVHQFLARTRWPKYCSFTSLRVCAVVSRVPVAVLLTGIYITNTFRQPRRQNEISCSCALDLAAHVKFYTVSQKTTLT